MEYAQLNQDADHHGGDGDHGDDGNHGDQSVQEDHTVENDNSAAVSENWRKIFIPLFFRSFYFSTVNSLALPLKDK